MGAVAAATDDFVIPTIDIGPYLQDPTSAQSEQIVQDVKKACMTTGFFSLVGHGIPKEMQERVLQASESLFALPLEDKRALVSPPLKNRGYELLGSQILQEGTLPDLKEVNPPFMAHHPCCHVCPGHMAGILQIADVLARDSSLAKTSPMMTNVRRSTHSLSGPMSSRKASPMQ